MHVIWFKRDLRIQDNSALAMAAKSGAILPLYIFEPELWRQPDMSQRHYDFLIECLATLDKDLRQIGSQLIIKVGDALSILKELHQAHNIDTLWSHQETWNGWTYKRDIAVKNWTAEHKIKWNEPLQHGVFRCLKSRDRWSTKWQILMAHEIVSLPESLKTVDLKVKRISSDPFPSSKDLNLAEDKCPERQRGGRHRAERALETFLNTRGEYYTKQMSSPLTAYMSCSRLSPHLAFGTISMKEVVQSVDKAIEFSKSLPSYERGGWPRAYQSFIARLHWHCHFMQKLEDEPSIEFENMHPAYDGIRESNFNTSYFEAWKTGNTGYPMIDACMRALTQTGWINFRMRAMLMSFASYHLWLHWRPTSLHLARLFTDYEPGIHYSQAQMQSGTTGINSIRAYNPIKQGLDQDPDGIFIKRWIPELSEIPTAFLHTPWTCPDLMNGYPMPIVDEKLARSEATQKLHQVRKSIGHSDLAKAVIKKHASRKNRSKKKSDDKNSNNNQIILPF